MAVTDIQPASNSSAFAGKLNASLTAAPYAGLRESDGTSPSRKVLRARTAYASRRSRDGCASSTLPCSTLTCALHAIKPNHHLALKPNPVDERTPPVRREHTVLARDAATLPREWKREPCDRYIGPSRPTPTWA